MGQLVQSADLYFDVLIFIYVALIQLYIYSFVKPLNGVIHYAISMYVLVVFNHV